MLARLSAGSGLWARIAARKGKGRMKASTAETLGDVLGALGGRLAFGADVFAVVGHRVDEIWASTFEMMVGTRWGILRGC